MGRFFTTLLTGLLVSSGWSAQPIGQEKTDTGKIPAKYQPAIDKGLAWIAKQQLKDGSWEAAGGSYSTSMTALAGIALLAEGSVPGQGKYGKELDKAAECLLGRCQKNGLIIGANQSEQGRYMFGHGFAMTFLAQVYAKEKNDKAKKELADALKKAVVFTANAQTKKGGWGYVSALDGSDFDEGCTSLTQIHALRTVQEVGLPVPKELLEKAYDYAAKSAIVVNRHQDAKQVERGFVYSLSGASGQQSRPVLTAVALAVRFKGEEYEKSDLAVQWLNHCQKWELEKGRGASGYLEYSRYYFAQVLYKLGEDGHAKLRPDLAEVEKKDPQKTALLKWSRYRDKWFDKLASTQADDGTWTDKSVGPVFATALNLTILQLDKGHLPMCRR